MRQYYFKNDTFDRVAVNLPLRILVGHKGIGKSALFKVAIAEDTDNFKLSILIKPDDIAEIAKNDSSFSQLIRQWKKGIAELIIRKVLGTFNVSPKLFTSVTSTDESFLEKLSHIITENIDMDVLGESKTKIFDQFLSNKIIDVFIDDLDRGWVGSKRDITRLSALINAVRDLSNENEGLKFKIALRTDVFYLVRTSDESTDKIQSSVIWYSWTNHEILVMLIKRIETFFGRNINEKQLLETEQIHIAHYLESIIVKKFEGSGKWSNVPMYRVLMSLIRKRPRDLVKLLTLAAREAKIDSSKIITTKHLKKTFDEYSQDRLQDTINEYRTELPEIERLLLGMKPSSKTKFAIDSYSFTTPQLMEKINNIITRGKFVFSNGEIADAKSLALFLYKINFLTAKKQLDTGKISRKYFEESRYLISRFADFGFDWEIHMAYRWALQPTSLDDLFNNLGLEEE